MRSRRPPPPASARPTSSSGCAAGSRPPAGAHAVGARHTLPGSAHAGRGAGVLQPLPRRRRDQGGARRLAPAPAWPRDGAAAVAGPGGGRSRGGGAGHGVFRLGGGDRRRTQRIGRLCRRHRPRGGPHWCCSASAWSSATCLRPTGSRGRCCCGAWGCCCSSRCAAAIRHRRLAQRAAGGREAVETQRARQTAGPGIAGGQSRWSEAPVAVA